MLTPLPQRREAKDDEQCAEGHTRLCGSHAWARGCACKLRRWGGRRVLSRQRILQHRQGYYLSKVDHRRALWRRREVRFFFVRSHYDEGGYLRGSLGRDAQNHRDQGERVRALPLHCHIE